MSVHTPARPAGPIAALVVTHDSAAVVERCLISLREAAPRRGLEIRVVDNASRDDGPERAARLIGAERVLRLPSNRGFAAGVNAGLEAVPAPWRAVLNPDTVVAPGALDALADLLEARPRAALVAPRMRGEDGRVEATTGRFPTLARERAHTWLLDRLLGLEGRGMRFPNRTEPVDWVSGCAWLLRTDAYEAVGPLDEDYFMYYEDVDYGRRLHDAGWEVLATPEVELVHAIGQGSSGTSRIPAEGGAALVRYFGKFHPEVAPADVRALLANGWRLRLAWRRLRKALGDRASARVARRYELALEALSRA